MKNGKINLAIISTGGRARYVVDNLLRDSARQVQIVAVYDAIPKNIPDALKLWQAQDAVCYDSVEGAIHHPGVDWVMIFSPNAFHKEAILAGFRAGKHVFAEKPLATTIDDCVEIHRAQQECGKLFMTGFVLRYAPAYRQAKAIFDSGELGRILAINADENIYSGHGGYIMRSWRRNTELSGPHLLEKCCHDFDLLNWFADSLPSKVAAFGGLDFFRPENAGLEAEFPEVAFFGAEGAIDPAPENAFLVDKNIRDNHVSILEYRNGIKVQFQATMFNGIPERRMYFSCTRGNLIVELYSNTLTYRRFVEPEEHVFHFDMESHGGGDAVIMKELFHTMTTLEAPKTSGLEGLQSAVTALAVDQAITEQRIMDLEPTWQKLGL